MKNYTQKYKDFTEFIYKNIKYYTILKDDIERIEMLWYIWVYYNYMGRVGYLKILEKRWKLNYLKENYQDDYQERITKIGELDQLLFYNFFSKSYQELSGDEKNKISLDIKNFIVNEVTEDLFLKFTGILWEEFEFIFYTYYETVINNKKVWEQNNDFLQNKYKDVDEIYYKMQLRR